MQNKFLTPQVEKLVNRFLTIVPSAREDIDSYVEMLHNPVVNTGVELRVLLTLWVMGDYSNPDRPDIEAYVKAQFAAMPTKFKSALRELEAYKLSFGNVFAEKVIKRNYQLGGIQALDPRRFDYVGSYGQVDYARYRGVYGNIDIKYKDGIHLVNLPHLAIGRDPNGVACCKIANPYWEAFKITSACLAIATQFSAAPATVGETDTNQTVTKLDDEGAEVIENDLPVQINKGTQMLENLESLRTSGVMAVGRGDKVYAIANETKGELILGAAQFFQRMILLSFLVPDTIMSVGGTGTGDSGLNAGHMQILMMVVRESASELAEAVIEDIVKPLIIYNYGAQDSYGHFPIKQELDPLSLQIADTLVKLGNAGLVDKTDLAVLAKARETVGI